MQSNTYLMNSPPAPCFSEGVATNDSSSQLISQWRATWPKLSDYPTVSDAATDLVDQVTALHRQRGALPSRLASEVIREGICLLLAIPQGATPKPRPPQQDPWGLAAAEFLFEIIEWCRFQSATTSVNPRLTTSERNLAVRDFLTSQPSTSLRECAKALGLPASAVQRTPAWQVVAERRRAMSARQPRACSLNESVEQAGELGDAAELDRLIAEQAKDRRSSRVYASERI